KTRDMTNAVIITGSEGGIVTALCARFRDAGYTAIGLDRIRWASQAQHVHEVALDTLCTCAAVQKATEEQISEKLNNLQLHAVVNNAAIQIVRSFDDLRLDDWHTSLNVNVLSAFWLVQTVAKRLRAARGSVVNVGSVHGLL